jgi:hypothetical protein
MNLRRLVAWLRGTAGDDAKATEPKRAEMDGCDLEEFSRLLTSGKREDLQKIARDLGQKSAEPSALRQWVDGYENAEKSI